MHAAELAAVACHICMHSSGIWPGIGRSPAEWRGEDAGVGRPAMPTQLSSPPVVLTEKMRAVRRLSCYAAIQCIAYFPGLRALRPHYSTGTVPYTIRVSPMYSPVVGRTTHVHMPYINGKQESMLDARPEG